MGKGGLAWLEFDTVAEDMNVRLMNLSPLPEAPRTQGRIVLCGNLAQSRCRGVRGQICLIERGTITFEDKALNCEKGGGIAAIIYNNVAGDYNGKLAEETQVNIPVTSVSRELGMSLLNDHLEGTATIGFIDGYSYNDGTSMVRLSGQSALRYDVKYLCLNLARSISFLQRPPHMSQVPSR